MNWLIWDEHVFATSSLYDRVPTSLFNVAAVLFEIDIECSSVMVFPRTSERMHDFL